MNIDNSFKEFKKFKSEIDTYRENLSESDTRCKYLDKLFIDVLGWKEENIQREGYVKPGYFDYEFSTSQFRFVVEAKKINVEFKLPDKGTNVKLRTIYNSNKEVIDQIREYIQKRNLSYGIISNGKQFIVARFINTDGTNWLENKAFFFRSIEDIYKDFVNFYNLFSYECILKNGRIKLFKEDIVGKHIVEHKLLRRRTDEIVRNEFSDVLVSIIGQIFSEIYETNELNDYEKLKQCYVSNDDVRTSNSKLGMLFEDEPPSFDSRILPVKNTEHAQEQITSEIEKPLGPVPEPVIIIGSKGSGKTTFIKYFIEIEISEKLKKERPILYFDFRNYTNQQVQDTKSIYSKIYNALIDKYDNLNLTQFNILKTIYLKEINDLKKGIWSIYKDDEEKINEKLSAFLEKKLENTIDLLEHIAKYLNKFQRKRLTIVLDNADQLDEESQKELYLLANSLRNSLSALVIISLREGYFYEWKNKPPFDAYQANVFHITAPSYSQVLKKRIDYVIENFDFSNVETNYKNKHLKLSPNAFNNFFRSLSNSLFNDNHSDLMEFLEETSYPNIREGLDNFNSFLTSGHTQISDYVTSDSYNIPIWEFIKSIALESRYYYKSEYSRIKNLLSPTKNNLNHFTKIRLLFYLQNQAELHSFKSHFDSIAIILELFGKSGYASDIIISELTELLEFKLIETKASQSDIEKKVELSNDSEVKITQSGVFYLNKLLPRFHYIDLVLQDTPIFDEYFFERLQESFPEVDANGARDLRQRLITVATFIEYLRKSEIIDHSKNELNYGHKAFDINIVDFIENNALKNDIKRIEKSLNR